MKNLVKLIIVAIALVSISIININPAYAGDVNQGAQIFSANCSSCHMGGRNVVNPVKTLQKSDLENFGMYDLVAIKNQVMNGKGAMPSFSSRLSAEDIDNVASYVISQADNGWQS
jgi:cytochrome c6